MVGLRSVLLHLQERLHSAAAADRTDAWVGRYSGSGSSDQGPGRQPATGVSTTAASSPGRVGHQRTVRPAGACQTREPGTGAQEALSDVSVATRLSRSQELTAPAAAAVAAGGLPGVIMSESETAAAGHSTASLLQKQPLQQPVALRRPARQVQPPAGAKNGTSGPAASQDAYRSASFYAQGPLTAQPVAHAMTTAASALPWPATGQGSAPPGALVSLTPSSQQLPANHAGRGCCHCMPVQCVTNGAPKQPLQHQSAVLGPQATAADPEARLPLKHERQRSSSSSDGSALQRLARRQGLRTVVDQGASPIAILSASTAGSLWETSQQPPKLPAKPAAGTPVAQDTTLEQRCGMQALPQQVSNTQLQSPELRAHTETSAAAADSAASDPSGTWAADQQRLAGSHRSSSRRSTSTATGLVSENSVTGGSNAQASCATRGRRTPSQCFPKRVEAAAAVAVDQVCHVPCKHSVCPIEAAGSGSCACDKSCVHRVDPKKPRVSCSLQAVAPPGAATTRAEQAESGGVTRRAPAPVGTSCAVLHRLDGSAPDMAAEGSLCNSSFGRRSLAASTAIVADSSSSHPTASSFRGSLGSSSPSGSGSGSHCDSASAGSSGGTGLFGHSTAHGGSSFVLSDTTPPSATPRALEVNTSGSSYGTRSPAAGQVQSPALEHHAALEPLSRQRLERGYCGSTGRPLRLVRSAQLQVTGVHAPVSTLETVAVFYRSVCGSGGGSRLVGSAQQEFSPSASPTASPTESSAGQSQPPQTTSQPVVAAPEPPDVVMAARPAHSAAISMASSDGQLGLPQLPSHTQAGCLAARESETAMGADLRNLPLLHQPQIKAAAKLSSDNLERPSDLQVPQHIAQLLESVAHSAFATPESTGLSSPALSCESSAGGVAAALLAATEAATMADSSSWPASPSIIVGSPSESDVSSPGAIDGWSAAKPCSMGHEVDAGDAASARIRAAAAAAAAWRQQEDAKRLQLRSTGRKSGAQAQPPAGEQCQLILAPHTNPDHASA